MTLAYKDYHRDVTLIRVSDIGFSQGTCPSCSSTNRENSTGLNSLTSKKSCKFQVENERDYFEKRDCVFTKLSLPGRISQISNEKALNRIKNSLRAVFLAHTPCYALLSSQDEFT